jgi:uncharacterized protein (TIGR03032 family)
MSQNGPSAPIGPSSTLVAGEPWLQVLGSRYLTSWLADQQISLAITTYQTGKLFLIGRSPGAEQKISVFERTFNRSMGCWASADAQTLWMSSQYQLWRFENGLAPGELHQGYDRLYIPRAAFTTGDIDIHDVAVEDSGRIVFAATHFNCLATLSERASFAPLWRPSFISALVPEDRCHLNGLALRDGRARYVTAVSQTDVADGWRDRRNDGGCVIDVQSNEIIARGLSMPHSPRWHRDKLWVLNSGTGELGFIDLQLGRFEPVRFCPGYLRGLTLVGDYAVVTLSKSRGDATFGGLKLDQQLQTRGADAQCGVQIIDLRTGGVTDWLRLEGMVTELYDAVVLPRVARPMALGLKTDEIARMLTVGKTETL